MFRCLKQSAQSKQKPTEHMFRSKNKTGLSGCPCFSLVNCPACDERISRQGNYNRMSRHLRICTNQSIHTSPDGGVYVDGVALLPPPKCSVMVPFPVCRIVTHKQYLWLKVKLKDQQLPDNFTENDKEKILIHHIKENEAKEWVLKDVLLGGPSPDARNEIVVDGPLGGRIRGGLVYEDYSMWQFSFDGLRPRSEGPHWIKEANGDILYTHVQACPIALNHASGFAAKYQAETAATLRNRILADRNNTSNQVQALSSFLPRPRKNSSNPGSSKTFSNINHSFMQYKREYDKFEMHGNSGRRKTLKRKWPDYKKIIHNGYKRRRRIGTDPIARGGRCAISGIIMVFDNEVNHGWDSASPDAVNPRQGHPAENVHLIASIFNNIDQTVTRTGPRQKKASRADSIGLLGTNRPDDCTSPAKWTEELVMFYLGLDEANLATETEVANELLAL